MQIIGGRFRGKKLFAVSDNKTRPTTCRVRENIFNLIGLKVRGSIVLDLFAGSGAFSAESISRGAKHIVANDVCHNAIQTVRRNIKDLTVHDGKNSNIDTEVFSLDYMDLLCKLGKQIQAGERKRFDLVFIDPPYGSDFGINSIEYLARHKMLSSDAIIAFETDKDYKQDDFPEFTVKAKKYGVARINILRTNP